jgi:hypothetical protein
LMYSAPDHAPLARHEVAFCAFHVTVTGTPWATVDGRIARPTLTTACATAVCAIVAFTATASGVSRNRGTVAARQPRVIQEGFT